MKLPFYLYPNTFAVILDLDHNNRINQVMYQRTLKLQKGIKNKIQLQFKNSDQKFLNVSSSTFVFMIYDTVNQRALIEKPVSIIDDGATLALKGLGEVVFTESEMDRCENSYYRVGIKALDTDGSYLPAYVNTYYDVSGTVEVRNDLYPLLVPSQEVIEFQTFYNAPLQQYEYYSGNLASQPQFRNDQSLHTMAVYMTNYKGQVLIEGTLESSPTSFGHYAVISIKEYDDFTGIDYTNFNGVFSKVRVRYIPEENPGSGQNNDTAYAGTVDRILYRS